MSFIRFKSKYCDGLQSCHNPAWRSFLLMCQFIYLRFQLIFFLEPVEEIADYNLFPFNVHLIIISTYNNFSIGDIELFHCFIQAGELSLFILLVEFPADIDQPVDSGPFSYKKINFSFSFPIENIFSFPFKAKKNTVSNYLTRVSRNRDENALKEPGAIG